MISDPGFLTLFSSFIGAALFFCAGVFWNERTEAPRGVEPRASRTHAPELFGVDASALPMARNSKGDAAMPAQRAGASGLSATRSEPASVSSLAAVHPEQSQELPPLEEHCASLDDLLTKLGARLQATSIFLFDSQGLLFSQGEDELGIGARLCTMLSVQDMLPSKEDELCEPQAFVLGKLRLQRVPKKLGAQAWLASVGGSRLAQGQELEALDLMLAREL